MSEILIFIFLSFIKHLNIKVLLESFVGDFILLMLWIFEIFNLQMVF